MSAFDPELPFAFLDTGHSRIGLSILRRGSPVLEAVLNGAHRSYVNLAPPSHPSTGRIGASLVVNCWAINSARPAGQILSGAGQVRDVVLVQQLRRCQERDGRSVLAQAAASVARVDSAVPPAAPNSPDVRVSGE